MGALERVVELLRPLVKNKEWDYCVIWKLGDDPSSFIKWVDCCCCGGAANGHATAKEESGEDVQQHIFPICKDIYFPHLAKTKACEALAKYPASMPLYSGIHGDVAISNTQMWITSNATASNPKPGGTQVIIPVVGGLIELFSTKNVLKDQKLVEYITAHYNMSLEHEIMTGHCNTNNIIKERSHDPFVNESLRVMPMLQTEAPNFNIDGSPANSTPLDCPTHVSLNKPRDSSKSWELNLKSKLSKKEETKANLLCSKRAFDRKDRPKSRQRTQMESYQSKNVLIERNRRQRIKDGLFTLRALVPKISKMDRASILGDAVDYIADLQKMIASFQTELKELEEAEYSKTSPIKQSHEGLPNSEECQETEVQMEIIQIGKREFLLKFIHSRKQAGVLRLLEAIHCLGFQVVDINVTTCEGRVMNIFKMEVNQEDFEPNELKESLLAIWTSKSDIMHEEKSLSTVIHQGVQVGI